MIFKKRRKSAFVPWDRLGRIFKPARGVKLGVGKRQVKRILPRHKIAGEVSASVLGKVDAAKMFLPGIIPVANAIWYVRI